jgi:hypothetical protein
LQREPRSASLECVIHVFKATPEADDAGYFILRDHTLVTIRFGGIDLKSLTDFNNRNAIYDLNINGQGPFNVDIQTSNASAGTQNVPPTGT